MSAEPDYVAFPGADALMDLYLEEHRAWWDASRPQGRDLTTGWRASQLGTCPQAQIRERYGEPATRVIDARTRRNFAWGDMVEDFYRTFHQRCGLVAAAQVALRDDELDLSGHLDLVLSFPPASVDDIPEDVRAVWSDEWVAWLRYLRARVRQEFPARGVVAVEVKSTHSRSLPYLAKDGPKHAHAMQVGAYMLLSRRVSRRDPDAFPWIVDRWRIDYVGKDTVGVVSCGVPHAYEQYASMAVSSLNDYWREQRDPADVPCTCTGWEVEFCRYSETLEPGPDGPRFRCCGGTGSYERRWRQGERP